MNSRSAPLSLHRVKYILPRLLETKANGGSSLASYPSPPFFENAVFPAADQ